MTPSVERFRGTQRFSKLPTSKLVWENQCKIEDMCSYLYGLLYRKCADGGSEQSKETDITFCSLNIFQLCKKQNHSFSILIRFFQQICEKTRSPEKLSKCTCQGSRFCTHLQISRISATGFKMQSMYSVCKRVQSCPMALKNAGETRANTFRS